MGETKLSFSKVQKWVNSTSVEERYLTLVNPKVKTCVIANKPKITEFLFSSFTWPHYRTINVLNTTGFLNCLRSSPISNDSIIFILYIMFNCFIYASQFMGSRDNFSLY